MSENNFSNSGESQNSENKPAPFSLIKTGGVLLVILFLIGLCREDEYKISYELGKKIISNTASDKEWAEFNEKFYNHLKICPDTGFEKAIKAKAWNPDSIKIDYSTIKIISAIPNKETNRRSKLSFTASGIVTGTNGFGGTIKAEQEAIILQTLYVYNDKKQAFIYCDHN